jgi:hypothetical protein
MPKHHRGNQAERHFEPRRDEPAGMQEAPASGDHAEGSNDLGTKIATVAAVGVAAALIEAELVPGILLGAAAVLAPNVFPKLSGSMRPLVKSAIRAGYKLAGKTRETLAEASEQFQDIVAEVKAEGGPAAGGTATEGAASGEVV